MTVLTGTDDIFDIPLGAPVRASPLDAYEPVGIATGVPTTGDPAMDLQTTVVVLKAQRVLDGRQHDVMFLCGLRALAQLISGLSTALQELVDRRDSEDDNDSGEDDSGDGQPDPDATPSLDGGA